MKNIELASIDQIDLIMKIIKECTNHMIKNGIFQWNDKYPTKQSFIDDGTLLSLDDLSPIIINYIILIRLYQILLIVNVIVLLIYRALCLQI